MTYTYDILGRVIKEVYSDGRTVNYTYNSEGQLSEVSDNRESTTYYTYDSLGRLITSYWSYLGVRARYTYDENNRLTRADYSAKGYNLSKWSDSYETYTYSENESDSISDGTLTGMRMVSGGNISLNYDYLQRLTTRNIASKLTETYTYKAGTGTNTTTTQVNGKKNTLGSTVKNNFTYTYDANGNILTVADSVSGKSITTSFWGRCTVTEGQRPIPTIRREISRASITEAPSTVTSTGDSDWKDLLTKVDGVSRYQVYTGNMVNHKYEILNYKTKERTPVPKEQHIIVADCHEPTVSREVYERVQTVISLRHRAKKHE